MDFEGPKNSANTTISMWLSMKKRKSPQPFEAQTAPLALPQVLVRCCLAPSWLLRRCLARDCHDKCGDSVLPINFFKWNLQTIITPNSVPAAFVVTRSLPLFQGLFCIMYDEFIPKSCGNQNSRCWLHENSCEAGRTSIGLSVLVYLCVGLHSEWWQSG